MAYISSNKIRVFPSVGRSNYDIESQLTNENNISQIVRSLCRNRKSYVLSNSLTSNQPFEFVIYGFYFKILDATAVIDDIRDNLKTEEEESYTGPVWAGIKLYKNAEGSNESSSYQLLQLANSTAVGNDVHELDTGKPTDNPETSVFQGVVFDRTEDEVRNALKTAGGVVDGEVYVLQILGSDTSVPVQSLLHIKSSEVLDGNTDNYINSVFTTNNLTSNNSIKSNGTLTVVGHTTLASVTATLVSAPTFSGSLSGNADTATNLNSNRTFSFTGGDISGSATSSTGGYNITASIIDTHVTTGKIANKAVTNDKLADNTIKTGKLGFNVTMILTVSDKTLFLSIPEFKNN